MTLALAVRAADFSALDTPLLVLALPSGAGMDDTLGVLDRRLGGVLRRTLERREFRGGRDELLHLSSATPGVERVLLVGMGAATDRPTALRRAGALGARQGTKMGTGRLAFHAGGLSEIEAEAVADGLIAGAWDFKELKSAPPSDEQRASLDEAVILASEVAVAERGVGVGRAIGEGTSLARRLGMLPGNICTPDYLASTARELGQRHGMQVTVLGRAEMQREKMGCFLAVAQGTPQEPHLIVLEHRRGPAGGKPIGLVGKGLCFDSGGISIKPAQGMEWMKFDMCGAAGVLGAMETIGRLSLPVNVVGLIGTTTNMPSGTAMNPGDVVQASNGKYVEIINTDAEGRLVLADVLAYARRFEPAAVLDAATLTGACVIALGHTATGVMGTDEALVQEVLTAGKRAGEPGWPLPLWDDYKELIKSDVADIKNSGGRPAGTITAALFLKEFVDAYPWVHLDIAGTAYTESDLGTIPRGPTGVPVGTFVAFVRGRAH
ncbi:MAG TPA: leucyl aminopeptidase [Gemmatimonadaceae bacterium]|nr:leucyl aminopeptidase [Gemmatimonadaceae bacterium]